MTQHDVQTLPGSTVLDRDGDKLGTVVEVYGDAETNEPEWAAVKTGLFGSHVSLVPLAGSDRTERGDLRVGVDKAAVKAAPHRDPQGDLSAEEEQDLFRHYDIPFGGTTATATGTPGGTAEAPGGTEDGRQTVGRDTSGPTTDDAMTRSEEQLRVGTERVEAGRGRLSKYVVTEEVTQTVPVSHEEVRVEREPVTDANRGSAMDGPAISEEEHEVVLHAERPVVDKETVPVERIRLATNEVQREQEVSDSVRKEQVDTDGTDRR